VLHFVPSIDRFNHGHFHELATAAFIALEVGMDRAIFVISDLHISNGALDDFDEELEGHLASFLTWITRRPEPCELVINGDFLDFVQASPWSGRELESATKDGIALCFSEIQSVAKLEAIGRAHPSVFSGLNTFLSARPENRLVILPGNHDPDFFWPLVREQFAQAVGQAAGSTQLQFCLRRAYRPRGYEWLWIEHGHQFDPVNDFLVEGQECWCPDSAPIFQGVDGRNRLYECTGTRFLIQYLNGLDAHYPYVDNVKPFSRFVRLFGTSALASGWGPLYASVAVTKMLSYLTRTAATRYNDLLSVRAQDGTTLDHALIAWINHASDPDRSKLVKSLRGAGFDLSIPLEMVPQRDDDLARLIDFLAGHPEVIEGIGEKDESLLGENPGTLTLKVGFTADETEELYTGARGIVARNGVTAVIMGHTHEPVSCVKDFTYLNTGCWTRYYRFGDEEPTLSWRILRERSYERFPYHLQYAFMRPDASTVTLETWRERSKA
jgi:UDP-2,3-diacylglucosamine pyrophosphatase LpxH